VIVSNKVVVICVKVVVVSDSVVYVSDIVVVVSVKDVVDENAQYWLDIDLAKVRLALANTKLVCRTDFSCAHYMSDGQNANIYIFAKIMENRLSYMKCSILVLYWPNIGTLVTMWKVY